MKLLTCLLLVLQLLPQGKIYHEDWIDFNKLKKSYQYKIIHKTDNDKRIVFCPCRDAQNYHNRNFNKLIILGAEDVDYERLSTLITKSENVVLMCDKESSSKDSIISLLGENIVTFDYSSSNME